MMNVSSPVVDNSGVQSAFPYNKTSEFNDLDSDNMAYI